MAAYSDNGSSDGPDNRHFTGYSVSTDGGETWADRGAVSDGPIADEGTPSLAVDTSSGRVYLATDGPTPTADNALVFRSDDNGLTFGGPVVASDYQSRNGGLYFPTMAVDNQPGPGRGTV